MALTIDSQESGGTAHRGATSGTALTWSFTNTGGNLLIVGVVVTSSTGAGNVVQVTAGPTYNGVQMTLVPGTQIYQPATENLSALYFLRDPATSANTVSVTGTNIGGVSFAILAWAMSFGGADIGVGAARFADISGTTATALPIVTANGNYLVASGCWGSGLGGVAGAGFTRTALLNGSGATAGDDILGEYGLSSGSSISSTFTWTNSDHWAISACDVIALPGSQSWAETDDSSLPEQGFAPAQPSGIWV